MFNSLKEKKLQKKLEYITKSDHDFQKIMKKINTIKEKANKIIKSEKLNNHMLEEALKLYTEAIDLKIIDKINSILYSNRAYVYLKLVLEFGKKVK